VLFKVGLVQYHSSDCTAVPNFFYFTFNKSYVSILSPVSTEHQSRHFKTYNFFLVDGLTFFVGAVYDTMCNMLGVTPFYIMCNKYRGTSPIDVNNAIPVPKI
jgi:hypothetical protein